MMMMFIVLFAVCSFAETGAHLSREHNNISEVVDVRHQQIKNDVNLQNHHHENRVAGPAILSVSGGMPFQSITFNPITIGWVFTVLRKTF